MSLSVETIGGPEATLTTASGVQRHCVWTRNLGRWVTLLFLIAAVAAPPPSDAASKARRSGGVLFKIRAGAKPRALSALRLALSSSVLRRLDRPWMARRALEDGPLNLAVSLQGGESEEAFSERLAASGAVEFAEPDFAVEPAQIVPNDLAFSLQWWHWNVETPAAWDKTVGSPSVLVAVCDSGFSVNHPDLAGNLVLPGYNVLDGSDRVAPEYSHGTQVAGIIGATGNNGIGVAGMAWDVSMLPIKVSDPALGGGRAFISDIVAGIFYGANRGARVVNVSFDAAGSAAVSEAANYLRERGGLLVVSAGNEPVNPGYPDYPSFLCVGATGSGTMQDQRIPGHFGGFIDLMAPGDTIYTTGDFEAYTYFAGTSAAAPVVAGLAALVYSVQPWFGPGQVETILRQTCRDLGRQGEDDEYGAGRVVASAAVDMAAGDLNGDNRTDAQDYTVFRNALGSARGQSRYNALADYNGDGQVSYADYSVWYRCYQARLN